MEKEGIKGDLQMIFRCLYIKVPVHKSITHLKRVSELVAMRKSSKTVFRIQNKSQY